MQKIFHIILLLLVLPLYIKANDHLIEFWPQFNIGQWEKDKWKLEAHIELRFTEPITRLRYFEYSEKLAYQAFKYLNFRAGLTYITEKKFDQVKYRYNTRLEFEANPSLPLGEKTLLTLRNRLELRKFQDNNAINFRSRHRLRVAIEPSSKTTFKTISMSDEIFYDYTQDQFVENRYIPIQFEFEVSSELDIALYLMLKSSQATSGWSQSFIIGSNFDF
ncbi:MAG: DUF2490 domain-containing protein [Parachlamydiales bacterium]|jgi:hypothetical protein